MEKEKEQEKGQKEGGGTGRRGGGEGEVEVEGGGRRGTIEDKDKEDRGQEKLGKKMTRKEGGRERKAGQRREIGLMRRRLGRPGGEEGDTESRDQPYHF